VGYFIELGEQIRRQFAGVVISPAHDLAEDHLVFE
jgi:hypothetical protein